MGIELTEEQRGAVLQGEAVRLSAPEVGEDLVLLRAKLFDEIQDILQDNREQAVFRAFARKQAARLARESTY